MRSGKHSLRNFIYKAFSTPLKSTAKLGTHPINFSLFLVLSSLSSSSSLPLPYFFLSVHTCNAEDDDVAGWGRGRNLTLVFARVPAKRPDKLQYMCNMWESVGRQHKQPRRHILGDGVCQAIWMKANMWENYRVTKALSLLGPQGKFVPRNPTTNGGIQNGSSVGIYSTRLCMFCADLHARSVLIDKISASELSRKSIKALLLAGKNFQHPYTVSKMLRPKWNEKKQQIDWFESGSFSSPVHDGLDLQQVVLAEHLVDGPEPEVGGVGQSAQGQQVGVAVAEPRHLKKKWWKQNKSWVPYQYWCH